MPQNAALEIMPGRSKEVMEKISHLLEEANPLPTYSYLLKTEIWVAQAQEGVEIDSLKVDGVIGAESSADHIFYSPFPPMKETTEPGIEKMSKSELKELLNPIPSGSAFLEENPFGTPNLSKGVEIGLPTFQSYGDWDRILTIIGAKEAWKTGNKGQGSVIAFVDSGVDGKRVPEEQLLGAWSDCGHCDPLSDENGHGSMTCLIAASREEVNGFSGVAPNAKVYIAKPHRDERGVLSTAGLMRAMDQVFGVALELKHHRGYRGKVIINNSWGLYGCKPKWMGCKIIQTRAMMAMDRHGCAQTVWAAGNNHGHNCGNTDNWCMNSLPVSVSIGATDRNLFKQPYSSVGGQCYPVQPTVVCPTFGALPWGSEFRDFGELGGGTSSCAPMVSGALAILDSAYPAFNTKELRAALRGSALRLGPDPDWNEGTGSGLLQIHRALAYAPRAGSDLSYWYEREFVDNVSTVRRGPGEPLTYPH